jgi:hypothetical protein
MCGGGFKVNFLCLIKHRAFKMYGYWRYISIIRDTTLDNGGQLYASVVLSLGKSPGTYLVESRVDRGSRFNDVD